MGNWIVISKNLILRRVDMRIPIQNTSLLVVDIQEPLFIIYNSI